MNTQQRGIYQPLVENVPIYDLTEEEDEDVERSRLPLLIVAGLVVLAAFTGVVWLAYNQGVERGSAGATRIIAAPEGPIRTAPTQAENRTAELENLSIYGTPTTPEQETRNSQLAAPPPLVAPPPPAAATPRVTTPPPAAAAPRVAATPTPTSRPQPRPATDVGTTPVVAPPVPAPAAVAQAAPPPAAPAAASPPATRAFFLQIGAYETEALAEGSWKALQNRYAEVMGSLAQDVQRADLGARGIWYRLRAGPFADRASAVSACEKLKSRGGNCFVTAS